jgi:plasmid stabilization system protein ParE
MKRVRFSADAKQDLDEAAAWYSQQKTGLGDEFAMGVRTFVLGIADFPNAGQKEFRGARSRTMRRFPYRVVYLYSDGLVTIVAVVHTKRRPATWRRRLKAKMAQLNQP